MNILCSLEKKRELTLFFLFFFSRVVEMRYAEALQNKRAELEKREESDKGPSTELIQQAMGFWMAHVVADVISPEAALGGPGNDCHGPSTPATIATLLAMTAALDSTCRIYGCIVFSSLLFLIICLFVLLCTL